LLNYQFLGYCIVLLNGSVRQLAQKNRRSFRRFHFERSSMAGLELFDPFIL